jgi:hypothetical protein
MKANQKNIEAMMETCLEKTEATDLEANPQEMKSIKEQQEVPNEEGEVETVRALKG